jgi:hypothetical protein
VKDLFLLDSMLTPKIISVIYWLGLIAVVVGAINQLFDPATSLLNALGLLLFGLLGVRIWCELMIVLFKINANLQALVERKE